MRKILINLVHRPFQVGKYLVTPLTQVSRAGLYRASVSIRSGRGSAMCDRITRFVPDFSSSEEAARYACERGREWLSASARGTSCLFTHRE